jgi:hypothetical protein
MSSTGRSAEEIFHEARGMPPSEQAGYLARDTRLDRSIPIKALSAHLAQDQDRLTRFQREARALGSSVMQALARSTGWQKRTDVSI